YLVRRDERNRISLGWDDEARPQPHHVGEVGEGGGRLDHCGVDPVCLHSFLKLGYSLLSHGLLPSRGGWTEFKILVACGRLISPNGVARAPGLLVYASIAIGTDII